MAVSITTAVCRFPMRGHGFGDQLAIEDFVKAMVLRGHMLGGDAFHNVRLGKELAEIESLGLPMGDGLAGVKPFGGTRQLIEVLQRPWRPSAHAVLQRRRRRS